MLYLLISILRAAALFAIFVGSWIAAYGIGQIVVRTGMTGCPDGASCELLVGIVIMPLGGTGLYILALVIWALSARKRTPSTPA
ncbi:hypothetical protein L598_000200002280 [Mesorhizobium sp. J18]|uniref:hypothetical protein n=1 Tax=Mesorhizobium sp. J18 TaxID=935263 RepID=UPI001198F1BB|nr:hypothetical protein [Mesorhizobium sp. J18]TWG98089.1 hypothetical protein L598_000200002280 [Mesorhizobium sp. J18]